MTQEEFVKLSEKEVSALNGSKNEEAFEAWRDGYIHLQEILRTMRDNLHADEFFEALDEIIEADIDAFND